MAAANATANGKTTNAITAVTSSLWSSNTAVPVVPCTNEACRRRTGSVVSVEARGTAAGADVAEG